MLPLRRTCCYVSIGDRNWEHWASHEACTADTEDVRLTSTASTHSAAAQVAAERLSALARTNEAIERDEQLAQVALDSLGDVPPTAAGGSAAGAASTKLFTDADLPSLKMCHRWGGRPLHAASDSAAGCVSAQCVTRCSRSWSASCCCCPCRRNGSRMVLGGNTAGQVQLGAKQ